MNRKLIFTALALFTTLSCWSQSSKHISALFGYSTFYLPTENRPYVETYLSYDAWSLNFVKKDNQYQATIETILQIKSGDSTIFLKKYYLNSPTIKSIDETNFSFLDLQRFALNKGIYDLKLTIKDINNSEPATVVEDKLIIYYEHKKPAMSTVQLMATATKTTKENAFSRMGYDMQPYINDYVPEQIDRLNFYYEVYNIDQEVGFNPIITYAYIEEQETGHRTANIMNVTKHKSSEKIPVFTTLDISTLPSGNYNLVVEVHNKYNQNLLYKKVAFFRSNPGITTESNLDMYATTFAGQIMDENLLNYYLDALYPIASELEKTVIKDMIKGPGLAEKQAFFYKFWTQRDMLSPETKWEEYKGYLEHVDKVFSYPKVPGYKTDRGRVYLQYGPPDFVRDEKNFVGALRLGHGTALSEQMSGVGHQSQGHVYYLPYQLWRYNKLTTDDPNRVFLFWDEFRNGVYQLLNSNARGEVQDPLWERRLCKQQLNENVKGEVGEQFDRGY